MPAFAAAPALEPAAARAALRARGVALLQAAGRSLEAIPGASGAEGPVQDAALATSLMDLYRCTADRDVFECLVQWTAPALARRVRSRLRAMGLSSDAQEVLQDAIVNIYRYPDRFRASRPGAFAAWSSTIVDNAIRRQLRDRRRGPVLAREDPDVLLRDCADEWIREPSRQVQDREECEAAASAYALLLQLYLLAFGTLSDRERFVLEMVEVRGRRYAELADVLSMRPEALKMVVFRARKRVLDRLGTCLAGPADGGRAAAATPAAVAGLH